MALQKFIIERDIPKVGTFDREQLRQAAAKSNEVLRQVGPDIQWVESYVADNKTFCVYLAKDEAIIREHAEISGFPANKITMVKKISIRPPPQPELLAVGMRRNRPNPASREIFQRHPQIIRLPRVDAAIRAVSRFAGCRGDRPTKYEQ